MSSQNRLPAVQSVLKKAINIVDIGSFIHTVVARVAMNSGADLLCRDVEPSS